VKCMVKIAEVVGLVFCVLVVLVGAVRPVEPGAACG
jgi:hypothetical protein